MSHARLGPSNHRWPHCPGSVREEAAYPDIPGEAAVDGTGSHLLLELCMDEGVRAEAYIGSVIGVGHEDKPHGWTVNEERAVRVQMALDYITRRRNELTLLYPNGEVQVESESKVYPGNLFTPAREDWWGTADIKLTVVEDGVLVYVEVCDYKDGRSWVKEEGNTQLLSYLAGVMAEYIVSLGCKARACIVQPKTNPPVRYEDVEGSEVLQVANGLYKAAALTDDPDAPLIPGWWCHWCKHNPKNGGSCTAIAEKKIEEAKEMGVNLDLDQLLSLDVANASAEELASVLNIKENLTALIKNVEEESEARLGQGRPVPGWEMGEGRKTRVWTDEEQVHAELIEARLRVNDFAPRKLLSPAQIEKLITKQMFRKRLADLVETQAGKPKLTRIKAKKEVFTPSFI